MADNLNQDQTELEHDKEREKALKEQREREAREKEERQKHDFLPPLDEKRPHPTAPTENKETEKPAPKEDKQESSDKAEKEKHNDEKQGGTVDLNYTFIRFNRDNAYEEIKKPFYNLSRIGEEAQFVNRNDNSKITIKKDSIVIDNSPQNIAAALDIAEDKGWEVIKIKGGDKQYKAEMWFQASMRGLETTGYEPSEIDLKRLLGAQERERRANEEQAERLDTDLDIKPIPETPTQETPAQETPAQETPAQEAPAQEAPAQEAPAQEAPAQETPAQETPAQEIDAEKAEKLNQNTQISKELLDTQFERKLTKTEQAELQALLQNEDFAKAYESQAQFRAIKDFDNYSEIPNFGKNEMVEYTTALKEYADNKVYDDLRSLINDPTNKEIKAEIEKRREWSGYYNEPYKKELSTLAEKVIDELHNHPTADTKLKIDTYSDLSAKINAKHAALSSYS